MAPTTDGVIIVFFDIQEMKETQQRLAERELEFRTLVENTPDIITRWDHQYKMTYANSSFEKQTGFRIVDSVGKNIGEIGFNKLVVQKWNEKLSLVFKSGKQQELYQAIPTVDGEKNFFTYIVPELDVDGNIIHILSIARDITA